MTQRTPTKKTNCLKAKRARAVARRSNREEVDLNHNGVIEQSELDASNQMLELELREEKAETQKLMAWTAMGSMILFTGLLFTPLPLFDTERISSLADVLDVFYIAQAGIVGAYMGITAWMSRKGGSNDSF